MAFQPVPNCAEAVIRATISGRPIANVLNFYYDGGYSLANIEDLAIAIDTVVGINYLPLMSGDVSYVSTDVRGLATAADFAASANASAGPGTAVGNGLPANCSFCVKLLTGLTGRSQRGRFYAFPTSEANRTAEDTVDVAYAQDVADMILAFQTNAIADDWNLVVVSRFHLGAARTNGVHRIVTDITWTDLQLDSQRGRLH